MIGEKEMKEEKPSVGQFIRAFRRGDREDLVERLDKAALGQIVFVGEDEIAVLRKWPEYRSDVIQKGEDFFVKESLEFVIHGRKIVVRVMAAGSFKVKDEPRVRGYLLKG